MPEPAERPAPGSRPGEAVQQTASQEAPQEAPQYRAAHLRAALAADPRTAELGVQVTVRGEHVFLSGAVASPRRKEELDHVLHEHAATITVHNDVRVVEVGEPGEAEELR